MEQKIISIAILILGGTTIGIGLSLCNTILNDVLSFKQFGFSTVVISICVYLFEFYQNAKRIILKHS